MKKDIKKILLAFTLLLCFTTGQAIVFTHSHVSVISKTTQAKHSSASADDNCKICQINHSSTALLNIELPNTVIYGTAYKHLQALSASYVSISLVLAATRGPPTV